MRVPAMSVNNPAMSYKARREELSYLLVVAVCFHALGACSCATLRRWEDGLHGPAARRSKRFEQGNLWRWPQHQPPPQGAFHGGQQSSAPNLDQFERNLAQKVLSWSSGSISKGSTGVHGVHGKVLGPAGTSSTQLSDWLAMRPAVQCDDEVMTFTASGGGLAQLLVDRAGASPISPLQLPSYCGYSVRTSWSDLKMMAPYDACYITQENGSYVLPMLWWGSPLKLSCPVQTSTPAPFLSAPAVLCSPHGMAVQLQPQEKGAPMLGAIVNGIWVPFVSATCAQRVNSQPEELIFFIPFSAHCVFIVDGLQLHLSLNQREFILSCPVAHQLPPSSPSGSPGEPQIPNIPEPVTPTPTFPPPSSPPPSPPPPPSMPPTTQTQPQMPSFYDYLHYMHSALQLPQVYPPGPQPALPTRPVPGGAPGHQPHPQEPHPQQSLFPSVPGKFPPEYPSSPKLPDGPPQHPSGLYYHYVPLYYHAGPTVAPPPATQPPKAYYTEPTAAPVTTEPSPPIPSSPPFPPKPPFYSPSPYYYGYSQSFYPEHASPSLLPTTTPLTMIPKQPVGEPVSQYSPPVPFPPKHPFYSPSPYYYGYSQSFYPEHASPSLLPTTTPLTMIPKQPVGEPVSQYSPPVPFPPKHPFYSPSPYYYGYSQSFYPEHASPSLLPTTTPLTMIPKQPVGEPVSQYSPPVPISFPVPTPPAAKGPLAPQEHQQLWAQQGPCPSNTDTICSYYPYPYTQYPYQPPHPAVPQYPVNVPPLTITEPTTTSTTTVKGSTQPQPTPQSPHLQCLKRKFVVFLPFAHPDLIQVRDQKTWLFLSDVLPQCGYTTQMSKGSTVILQSPLPACHSQTLTPTSISLPVRFWDASMEQYRILNLQCPYRSTTSTTPTKVTPSVSSTPPSVSKGHIRSSVVPKPKVSCSSHQMTVELPPGPISAVAVKDIKGNRKNLQDAPKHCGYSSSKGKNGKIRLNLQLHTQCHMSVQGKMYTIAVIYMTVSGEKQAQFTCPVSISGPAQECNLPSEQRLPCGPGSVSQPHCLSLGCCFSMHHHPACYYPMDECTIDRHFVFSVPASLTEPPLSPSLLVAAGNSTCKPQKVTPDFALFKIPMDGCGARRVAVGKTLIYMVEIINMVQAISLNYGTITRDSPIRLLVECRYTPGTALTVSYMVKTPTVGPAIHEQGVIGVQLLIAKDAQYRSYYPQYHQPLLMLLGKPLYLEVRLLNAPDPSLVLLVHYCVAYPRSGKAVWVLLYNGCPNPLDPAPQQAVLFDPQPPPPQGQTRRFTISTFQFLPDGEFKDLDEEIYFMCSTEICSPRDGPCVEGCFGR